MYQNKTFLAIIPARGGSKRFPRKNLLDFAGKPLVAWTIQSGLNSEYLDEVMVTTDDRDIMATSKKYGAHVPFRRPSILSSDTATRPEVIKHTLEFYQNELNRKFDYLVYLQPTSPLRTNKHIDDAIEFMMSKKADAVVSVCRMEHPVQWSGILPQDMNMSNFLNNVVIQSRSQDLQVHYRLNGAIYVCKVERFLFEGCVFLKDNIYAFEMERDVSIDIDTKSDFLHALSIMDSSIAIKKKISEKVFQSYTKKGFGRLLKAEIDLIMFDLSLNLFFTEKNMNYFLDSELNYFAINKQDIYELSKKFKISEITILKYMEQIALLKGLFSKSVALDSFKNLLINQMQKKEDIKKGLLSVQITNKLLKQFIEAKVLMIGGQVKYDEKKEVIFFDLIMLVKLFDANEEKIKSWIDNQNTLFDDKEKKDIKTKLTKEKLLPGENTIEISIIIMRKLIEKDEDFLIGKILKLIGDEK